MDWIKIGWTALQFVMALNLLQGTKTTLVGNTNIGNTHGIGKLVEIARFKTTEDYAARLKGRNSWPEFPLRVYFVRDNTYTPQRQQLAWNGFSRWVEATKRFVIFKLVDNSADGQIFVRFHTSDNDGYTTTRFTDSHITDASITIGVKRNWPHDIECIAAHEMGHALGIDGHSNVASDLMYPSHTMGRPWSITQRDLNTLAALYSPDLKLSSSWTPGSVGSASARSHTKRGT